MSVCLLISIDAEGSLFVLLLDHTNSVLISCREGDPNYEQLTSIAKQEFPFCENLDVWLTAV